MQRCSRSPGNREYPVLAICSRSRTAGMKHPKFKQLRCQVPQKVCGQAEREADWLLARCDAVKLWEFPCCGLRETKCQVSFQLFEKRSDSNFISRICTLFTRA